MGDLVRLFASDSDPGPRHVPDRPLFAMHEPLAELIPGGHALSGGSRFGDDVWDLTGHPAFKDKHGGNTTIPLHGVPDRYRDAVRELVLLQLDPGLAARAADRPMAAAWRDVQEPVNPVTAQNTAKNLRLVLGVLERHRVRAFDDGEWERVQVLLTQPLEVDDKRSGALLSRNTSRLRAQQLIALWQTTQFTGRAGLLGRHEPFDGVDVNRLFANASKLNSVRPHEGVGHLLGYSAWLIDHAADDIVDHVEWWARNIPPEPDDDDDAAVRDAMLELVIGLAARHDGAVPGIRKSDGRSSIAAAALGRLVGVQDPDRAYVLGRWAAGQLRDAIRPDPCISPCPLPIKNVPDRDGGTTTWTARLLARDDELDIWQRRIVYALMYYLSATAMLRDQQLAELPLDCLQSREVIRPDGTSYVEHSLHGYRTKNRRAPVPTSVLVNARIARAVRLLQRLHRVLALEPALSPHTGRELLLDQRLATPPGRKARTDGRAGVYLDQAWLGTVRAGAAELHARGVIAMDLADVDINMRHVRITCAQAYASREHGQALAAAFGQWETAAAAAGYIGDVYQIIQPLDPDDLQGEVQFETGLRLTRAAAARDGYTGAGVPRLDKTVAGMQLGGRSAGAEDPRPDTVSTAGTDGDLPVANPAPLTPARYRSIGKKNPTVEQGPLTLCLFQNEGAMCGGRGKPDFRLCVPGRCRNSAMSPADRARYELMRRQNLKVTHPALLRAAGKLDALNPTIRSEFGDHSDAQLTDIVMAHVDAHIRDALTAHA